MRGNSTVNISIRGGWISRLYPLVSNSAPRNSITNKANYIDIKRPTA